MKRNYEKCIKEKLINPMRELENPSEEILISVKEKLKFWNEVKSIAEEYPTVLIESHYEIIKELLTALMNRDGFMSKSHDCLFYYFEEKHKDFELDHDFLHELRTTRNNINYRGVRVSKDTWKKIKLNVDLTIKHLIKILENRQI